MTAAGIVLSLDIIAVIGMFLLLLSIGASPTLTRALFAVYVCMYNYVVYINVSIS